MSTANYLKPGKTIDYYNSGSAIVANQIISLTSRIGIAASAIGALESGALYLEGIWELPAGESDTYTLGQIVAWDVADSKINTDLVNNPMAGMITEAKGATGTTAKVKLLDKFAKETDSVLPEANTVTNAMMATDVKIGSLAALTTTEKGSVQGAINEVNAKVATHQANSTANDVAGIVADFNTLIGKLEAAGLMAAS